MREILFRGKDVETGEWINGFYVCLSGKEHRIYSGFAETDCGDYYPDFWTVVHETVGQFTGLTDRTGKKIFEGDIVNVWWEQRTLEQVDEFPKYKAVIEFGNPNHLYSWGWQLKMIDDMPFNPDILLWVDMEEAGAFIEVIGNIHDNDLGDFNGD